jgi:uncharacterized DUF497 family protein
MFEWDDAKNAGNIHKHGVDFAYASRIFEGWVFTVIDRRFDYGERRDISVGVVDGVVYLTLVHTPRSGAIRIISARRASRSERLDYEREALRRRTDP